jgi:hypothetical protein
MTGRSATLKELAHGQARRSQQGSASLWRPSAQPPRLVSQVAGTGQRALPQPWRRLDRPSDPRGQGEGKRRAWCRPRTLAPKRCAPRRPPARSSGFPAAASPGRAGLRRGCGRSGRSQLQRRAGRKRRRSGRRFSHLRGGAAGRRSSRGSKRRPSAPSRSCRSIPRCSRTLNHTSWPGWPRSGVIWEGHAG